METHDPFGLVNTVIARKFRVDAVVGEGGFGIVYQGFHLSFRQEVAVKCLKIPPHFTRDAQALFVEKFREEGQHLAQLSSAHLSIVRVFDFDVVQTQSAVVPFLVLEWLHGRSLEAELAERRQRGQGGLAERDALLLLRPAVEALAAAHRMGIAHRDVKPANLFLTEGSGVPLKVLDFGIAKAMQDGETATQASTHTNSGFSALSPQYGAPEQFRPKKFGSTGPWTDVHGLGLCLVELVSGQPALVGEEAADWFEASTCEIRPTPRARGCAVSAEFEALCARALALTPRDRFSNAAELLDTLDHILARPSTPATPRAPAQIATSFSVPEMGAADGSGIPEHSASSPFLPPEAGRSTRFAVPALPTSTTPDTGIDGSETRTRAYGGAARAASASGMPPQSLQRLAVIGLGGVAVAATVAAVVLGRGHPGSPTGALSSNVSAGALPSGMPPSVVPYATGITDAGAATALASTGPYASAEGQPSQPSPAQSAATRVAGATPAANTADAPGGRAADRSQATLPPQANGAPATTAPATGAPLGEFDRAAAMKTLSAAAGSAARCGTTDGPSGGGRAKVTFAPSGTVTSVVVDGASFAGTPTAACIVASFRQAQVPPFDGSPVTVSKSFTVEGKGPSANARHECSIDDILSGKKGCK